MQAMKQEIYISIDVETDGPIPGMYSMLSLGAAAFDSHGAEIGNWYANLELLPGAQQHPDTMKFWSVNQEYYDITRVDTQDPPVAMNNFTQWVLSMDGAPVAVAGPAGFDFTFVYWYLVKFTGRSVFSFSCIDMKTLAMSLLVKPYKQSIKRNYPQHWFAVDLPHTHHALADAREQGHIFMQMLKDMRNDN